MLKVTFFPQCLFSGSENSLCFGRTTREETERNSHGYRASEQRSGPPQASARPPAGPRDAALPSRGICSAFPLRPTSSDFDLARAQDEHDALTAILRAEGAEVVELTELVVETLAFAPEAKDELLERFLANCRIEGSELTEAATRYMSEAADAEQFVTRLFNGIRYGDTDLDASDRFPLAALTDSAFDPDTFLFEPAEHGVFHARSLKRDRRRHQSQPYVLARPQPRGRPAPDRRGASPVLRGHAPMVRPRQLLPPGRRRYRQLERARRGHRALESHGEPGHRPSESGAAVGRRVVCHRCVRDRSAPERQPPASGRLPLSHRRGHLCGGSPPGPRAPRLPPAAGPAAGRRAHRAL